MKTKFYHIRYVDPETGRIDPRGGVTYAYLIDTDKIVRGYAVARCHEKDNYNKHIGRAKAEGRMKSKHYFHEVLMTEDNFIKAAENLATIADI